MISTSLMMTTQTVLKEAANGDLGLQGAAATALASLGAAAVTIFGQAPVDIVRARIYSPVHSRVPSVGECVLTMYREEGPRAFWKGARLGCA